MGTDEPEPAHLRRACADELGERYGYFEDGRAWLREAFLAVPREHFVPDRVWWHKRVDGVYPVLDRAARPRQWIRAVYRPHAALITQIADGQVRIEDGPSASGEFTSSISCSSVVVEMLHHLNPVPGEKVLEIGTGTGYSAALTAHRTGTQNLVTVEVNEQFASRAEERLAALGYGGVTVVCADGEQGWQDKAPYDQLISTAAVRQVPAAWLEQVRPGGLILTPLATPMRSDVLAWLRPDGHGGAAGGLIEEVYFMKLHHQRAPRPWTELGWPAWHEWTFTITPQDGPKLRTAQ
jgi:protein-L-isoaspartate(D-aspartate) O-methyltransferase